MLSEYCIKCCETMRPTWGGFKYSYGAVTALRGPEAVSALTAQVTTDKSWYPGLTCGLEAGANVMASHDRVAYTDAASLTCATGFMYAARASCSTGGPGLDTMFPHHCS
jgi:hypothetical protein